MQLVDENKGTHGSDTILYRTYRHGTDTVQVKIRKNFYANQSFATASVLTATREWNVIATELSGNWHAARTPIEQVADCLKERAAAILG